MAKLASWQVDAITDCIEVFGIDESGVMVPLSGPAIDKPLEKVLARPPWGETLSRWDVLGTLLRIIIRKARGLEQSGFIGLLKEAPGGAKLIEEIRKEFVGFLESLPRTYHVYFPLDQVPPIGQAELRLSDSISLIDTGVANEHDLRLIQREEATPFNTLEGETPKLTPNVRYLRLQATGYADVTLASPVAAHALAQLKHFLFVGLAKKVFKEGYSWELKTPGSLVAIRPPVILRHASLDEDEQYALVIPEELYSFLQKIKLNIDGLTYYDMSKGKTLLTGEARPPNTPEEIAWAIPQGLGRAMDFLTIPRDDPDAVRIKAAIEWWLDGVVNQNQTISFLQFCIGFEALLGDSTPDNKKYRGRGITERLADRFAYLRGRTQTERENLRNDFVKVYERRGVIVHQRETHLRRDDDADACLKSREMLFDAIVDELNALMAARKTRQQ